MRIRLIVTAKVSGEAQARWATQELNHFVRTYVPFIKMQAENRMTDLLQVTWEPAPKCIRCGRELVVPQLLDHMDRPEGTVCMMCMGGS